MPWNDIFRYPYLGIKEEHPLRPLKVNEKCFIRKDHKCGKIYGASKSCFVACPSENDIGTILELISEKLAKVGIEAIIAVKERAYGQDIFCTKICGKIIESKFCLVILDDSIEQKLNIPNPNVYYEYGLMTSLEKHIIPLQKDKLKLAFNIQSYDTIKYTSGNIGAELDRAIKDAIKITESKRKQDKKFKIAERSIYRNFELANFEIVSDDEEQEDWFLFEKIDDTEFKGFIYGEHNFYIFLGKIDNDNEFSTYLEDMNVVIFRIEKETQKQKQRLKSYKQELKDYKREGKSRTIQPAGHYTFDLPKKSVTLPRRRLPNREDRTKARVLKTENRIKLMSSGYFGFIINPELNSKSFIKKAEELIAKNDTFEFSYNRNSEIVFGDIKVILSPAP